MTPAEIKALQEENAKLKESLATEENLSKALQEELTKKQAPAAPDNLGPKIPGKTVRVGKKEFKFIIPAFNLGGEVITAEQAIKDDKVLAALEAMNFGGWQQVN